MSTGVSVHFYRLLTRAYPAEFRGRFGASVEQSFRDMMRDSYEKHGYLGLALLWFQILPDFLFSFGELVMRKAGDFLKWRLRLQWVIACSLGFGLARGIALLVGRELYVGLEASLGIVGRFAGTVIMMTILMGSVGLLQSWVLAGRCFRKREWVLYALTGSALAAVVLQPLPLLAAPAQVALVRWVQHVFSEPVRSFAVSLVTTAPIWLIVGGLTGLLQATAIRSDAISRYQWMRVSALGYFLSAMAGGFVIPYNGGPTQPADSVLHLVLAMITSGAILGLVTSGSLEKVLFNVHADSGE
jgi:hypothetical protein